MKKNRFDRDTESLEEKPRFLERVFPGIVAAKESIKQKSFQPYKEYLADASEQFKFPQIKEADGKKYVPDEELDRSSVLALSVSPGSPVSKATTQLESPVSKLIKAIKSAATPQKGLEVAQKTERARRAATVENIFSRGEGKEGYKKALGSLKGELVEKPRFEPLKVVDNADEFVSNKQVELSVLQDAIDNHPAKNLIKYTNKKTGELAEVTGNKRSKFANEGDSISTEVGFKDSEAAREAIQEFRGLQSKALTLEKEIAETKKTQFINQTDVDDLFNQVQMHKNLNIYERVAASNGLEKLFRGELPQPSQLSLMEDVFGKDLILAVREKRPNIDKIKDIITETLNIPRSLITSFDMSSVLRQGVLFSTTKPKATVGALNEMFKQTFSQKNFEKWLNDIPDNPRYRQMKDSGLYISNPLKVSGGLAAREEQFMTNFAERIPVIGQIVKASGRSYVSYLNKLRVDVFNQLATQFEKEGVADPENLKSLAEFINNATGRGNLGKLNASAQVLNNIFFSPRLIAARFNMLNPVWYAKQTPRVRKEAIKTFAQFVGVGSSILTLAKLGGADVEVDPRSTDFGKIKVGNTRWDIWGGFQQWIRVFSQLASGQRKTAKGEVIEIDPKKFPFESRLDVGTRFLRGKLAPVPSLSLELLEGQKLFGEELSLKDEVAQKTIPLYLQDMQEAIDEMGPEAIFLTGVPSFFGVGVQTYKEKAATNRFNR